MQGLIGVAGKCRRKGPVASRWINKSLSTLRQLLHPTIFPFTATSSATSCSSKPAMVVVDKVVRKLEDRHAYLENARCQRRSIRQALSDAIMKISPATWLGRYILKAHALHEYKKDRKQAEGIFEEYQQRRGSGRPMSTNSIVALETILAPVEPIPSSSRRESDPWRLPPAEEIH